jgi:hypothetical protein
VTCLVRAAQTRTFDSILVRNRTLSK